METVKMSFGHKGSLLFSTLNVLQLLGWTAIMIYDGALAAGGALGAGQTVWCLVIGGTDSGLDSDRNTESWENKHGGHGRAVYFNPDSVPR